MNLITRRISSFQLIRFRDFSTEVNKPDTRANLDIKNEKHMSKAFKNLVISKFNSSVIKFPSIISNDDVDSAENLSIIMNKLIQNSYISGNIDELSERFRSIGIFTLTLPKESYGSEYNLMMLCTIIETFRHDYKLFYDYFLNSTLAARCIDYGMNIDDKRVLLNQISMGECNAVLSIDDKESLDCQYEVESVQINGQVQKPLGYENSDVIILFSKIKGKTVCLKIDSKLEGISLNPEDNTVVFDKLHVSMNNLLNELEGEDLLHKTLQTQYIAEAAFLSGMIKSLLEVSNHYVSSRKMFGKSLGSFANIQKHISELTVWSYVAESVSSFIAGNCDLYFNTDFLMETHMAKLVSIEALENAIESSLSIIGLSELEQHKKFAKIYEDSLQVLRLSNNCNKYSQYVKLGRDLHSHGLSELAELNSHWKFRLFRKFRSLPVVGDHESASGYTFRYPSWILMLHPRLLNRANYLTTYFAEWLQFMDTQTKHDHDNDLLNLEVGRYVADLFCCLATLTRATKSTSIGLRNYQHEIQIAEILVEMLEQRFRRRIQTVKNISANHKTHQKVLSHIVQQI